MKRISVVILFNLALTVMAAGAASYFGELRFACPDKDGVRFECFVRNARLVVHKSGRGCEEVAPNSYRLNASSIGAVLFDYFAPNAKGRLWVYRYWDKNNWAICVHGIVPFVLFSAYPCLVMVGFVRRRRRLKRTGACKQCGYDLTGNVSGVCSECGMPIHEDRARA